MTIAEDEIFPEYTTRSQPLSHQARHEFIYTLLTCLAVASTTALFALSRLQNILRRPLPPKTRPAPSQTHPTHLLIVLGSGGHTAEMLNILSNIPSLRQRYTHRTYVVSSGDGFSASKAKTFEDDLALHDGQGSSSYSVAVVRRAREIHQPLLTTPWNALLCLWDCVRVLRGSHPDLTGQRSCPDLILTNGPGTGVCIVVAAILLLFLGLSGHGPRPSTGTVTTTSSREGRAVDMLVRGDMRTLYIESWARVKTLSLSGRILKRLVDRFLVQWPDLAAGEGGKVEYIGPLVT